MLNYRTYGNKPYRMILIHGGPGALGDMGYLAERLSIHFGVIEALQTKSSIHELIEEMKEILEEIEADDSKLEINANTYTNTQMNSRYILAGHSWGAWLAYLFAAKYPNFVEKLILVGSGPFEVDYVQELEKTRMERMTEEQRTRLEELVAQFYGEEESNKDDLLTELGGLMEIVDTYSAIAVDDQEYRVKIDGDLYIGIWDEAAVLRKSGELLEMGSKLSMPIVVIHGEYDPHPAEGVIKPLQTIVQLDEVHILEKCGHTPWKERHAAEKFLEILRKEV